MLRKNNLVNFRRARSEIVVDILSILILTGVIMIATTSPYFIVNILKGFKQLKKYPDKKVRSAFYNLKKQGLIDFENKKGQIFFDFLSQPFLPFFPFMIVLRFYRVVIKVGIILPYNTSFPWTMQPQVGPFPFPPPIHRCF